MPPVIEPPNTVKLCSNILIWSDAGVGKTTLASTASGRKLWIQFDPQGVASIANRRDYNVLDLSGEGATSAMMEFNKVDPYGIGRFLTNNPEFETVVIDSATALAHLALVYGVTKAGGSSNIDVPGMNGYGVRNNIMRRVVASMMQLCAAKGRNLILTTHESAPDRDQASGNVTSVTMALSANIANDVSLRFNEVWFMKDTGRERLIYVRPHGVYKPMKTRMFDTSGGSSFAWNYNADTLEGDGIAQWWSRWLSNDGRKIALPKK